MNVVRHKLLPWVAASLLVVASGCEQGELQRPPAGPVYVDPNPFVTTVAGYVWDPEAMWFTQGMCGMDCPLPPINIPGIPAIERSLVQGVQVGLFDPVALQPTYFAPALTPANGAWAIQNVESRRFGAPFLPIAIPPPPGSPALRGDIGPPFLPPVPAANYLRTNTMKPVFTAYTACYGQQIPLASDRGILEAVALHLTANGEDTVVQDFLNPGRFFGVLVTWLYMTGSPELRLPAFATGITHDAGDAGRLFNIAWAPPGALPPEANQSTRGFYVDAFAPFSGIGVTVLLLDPRQGPPYSVAVEAFDQIEDSSQGRPWEFPHIPPVVVPPGSISWLELQGIDYRAPPPPQFVCLNAGG